MILLTILWRRLARSGTREPAEAYGSRTERLRGATRLATAAFVLAGTTVACGDEVREREEAAAAPQGTEVGQRAPDLSGRAADGGEFEYQPDGRTAAVVVFYRSFHCGLCRERLRELQAHLSEYEGSRARVVAVSPDSAALVRRAAEELGLTFSLVAADSAMLRRWDVLLDDHLLPLPATYLLDGNGLVAFRHVGTNAADRASDLEVLTALHNLRQGTN
jgi:peroxiredoxin